jgi:hypothetical protein
MSGQDREARTERLKPYRWKPGQSGTPKGRPKGRSLEEIVNDIRDEPVVNSAPSRSRSDCEMTDRAGHPAIIPLDDGQGGQNDERPKRDSSQEKNS